MLTCWNARQRCAVSDGVERRCEAKMRPKLALLLGLLVSDIHSWVCAVRDLGGASTDSRLGGDGRLALVCRAPVSCGHLYDPATAADAPDDSGVGRDRPRNSYYGTCCVRTNRVLAHPRSHLVIWPAAHQLRCPGVAPLGTKGQGVDFSRTELIEAIINARLRLPPSNLIGANGFAGQDHSSRVCGTKHRRVADARP
jgi:hypothetical protein